MKKLNPELVHIPVEQLRRRGSYKWARYPDEVLPAWVAEMDFPLAPPVRRALSEAVDLSDCGYSYPRAIGLGEVFAAFAESRMGWRVNPEWVSPTIGILSGISAILSLIAKPGDGVVLTPPVYEPFYRLIREIGSEVVEVPLVDCKLDTAAIDRRFAEGAAALILCSPHNPTGTMPTARELTAVAESAARYGTWVLADEVHAPLALPGSRHVPYLSLSPAAAERGISFLSASKAFNIAGLKCALAIAASEASFGLLQRMPSRVTDCGHFGAIASVAAFREGGAWLDDVIAVLDHNRRLIGELLVERLPEIGYQEPQGGYLTWLDLRRLEIGDDPSTTILERGRLALSPGLEFGDRGAGFARLNFGTSPELVEQAIDRLAAAIHRDA
jgi:cysteine-S-conjugate beta-lyase